LVDHRDDWTYSLVIPRGHPLEETRATESYRIIHQCIAAALQAQGVKARLATTPSPAPDPAAPMSSVASNSRQTPPPVAIPGICFQKSEIHDVISPSEAKIAGAAQKRTKRGLLFQGSIWRPAAGAKVDWDQFESDFPAQIAAQLGGSAQPAPWPDFNESEVEGLIEQYSAPEWLASR
jgi:lipoate-protein ligase A